MSLYYEAAAALNAPASDGGNLKTRIFGPRSRESGSKDTTSKTKDDNDKKTTTKKSTIPPAQIYALAAEACKWSAVLAEVIDRSGLLALERRTLPSPTLALLLVHDLLVSKGGAGQVQLPANHGLRMAVERHKARLSAELARVRVRRRAADLAALRAMVERDVLREVTASGSSSSSLAAATRWVRVNTLKTTLAEQLATTFVGYERVASVRALFGEGDDTSTSTMTTPRIYIDDHVPNLVAVPLVSTASSSTDLTRCDAYKSGAIILQDKASCFPAYLLDPAAVLLQQQDGGGDVIDACAAPGNKTSHLAALLAEANLPPPTHHVLAFEKDPYRSKTLEAMQTRAGALEGGRVVVHGSQDFMQVDPRDERYKNVRALLLDPSCSGSGIVGRDAMPPLRLPKGVAPAKLSAAKPAAAAAKAPQPNGKKKRKRGGAAEKSEEAEPAQAEATTETADATAIPEDPAARLAALASFQLSLLLHAFTFPAAQRITYSTCSVHAEENEQVVVKALRAVNRTSENGRWRLLRRDEQVAGMRAWPVRGDAAAAVVEAEAEGEDDDDDDDESENEKIDPAAVADACIRSYANDDLGVMGFFVAAFVKDDGSQTGDGPVNGDSQATSNSQASAAPKKKKKKKSKKKAKTTVAADEKKEGDEQKEEDDWSGFDD